jgi:hypothetical protein
MKRTMLGTVAIALLTTSCSSVVSRPQPFTGKPENPPRLTDGLTYWMPKRDIIVSVSLGGADEPTAAEGEKESTKPMKPAKPGGKASPPKKAQGDSASDAPAEPIPESPAPSPKEGANKPSEPATPESPVIKIGVTPSYADTTTAYVAHFKRNVVGKNQLTIEVNDRGLLSSAKSETTSQLSEIFSALGSAAGSISALASDDKKVEEPCPKKFDFVFRVDIAVAKGGYDVQVPNANKDCKVRVTVTTPDITVSHNARARFPQKGHSGFFYKQNLPYEVEVRLSRWTALARVMLPNDAPVQFLPVDKSLFANSSSDLAFSDGVLTKYGQTVDGEVLAVFKLPADVLQAYFTAIGSMFTVRKDAATNEAAYLDALLQLTKKQLSTEQCLAAYQSSDEARIEADCPK